MSRISGAIWKVKSEHIKYFLLAFVFFPPGILGVWPVLNSVTFVVSLLRYTISVVAIFLFLFRRGRKSDSKSTLNNNIWKPLTLLILWVLLADIKNHTDLERISSALRPFIGTIGYFCIIENSFKREKESCFFSATAFYCTFICLANVMTQFLLPQGLYSIITNWQPYYLCANGNTFVFFYQFVILVTTIHCLYKNKFSVLNLILDLLLVVSTYLAESDTGFAVVLFTLVVLFVVLNLKTLSLYIRKWYWLFLVLGIVFAVYMVVFRGWNSIFITNMVSKMFGGSAYGFSARGVIWQNAVLRIKSNPIFGGGNGIEMSTVFVNGRYVSAHNCYLEIALIGGIPALIFFLIILLKPFLGIKRCKDKRYLCGLVVLTGYIIAYLFEQRPYYSGVYVISFITSIFLNYGRMLDKSK